MKARSAAMRLKMDIDETMQLVLSADNAEEQEFFSMLSDFILQQRQKEVIRQKRF